MSRSELERAMGQVLTSVESARQLRSEPVAFGRGFDLDAAEQESLLGMQWELIGLAGGFVSKRQRLLRRVAARSLAMLDQLGEMWMAEYIEEHPPVRVDRGDVDRWLSFLLDRLNEYDEPVAGRSVMTDMIRFERIWQACFRTAATVESAPASQPGAPIRLSTSAELASFGYDVRNLQKPTPRTAIELAPSPCTLLFFRTVGGAVRIIDVEPGELADLLIDLAIGPLTLQEIASTVEEPEPLLTQVTRLIGSGALVS